MRLIDSDALKDDLCFPCDRSETGYSVGECRENGCGMMSVIDKQPTIEAVKVKHGQWILIDRGRFTGRRDLKCSVCGNTFRVYDNETLNAGRGDANYCPNCGSKNEWR